MSNRAKEIAQILSNHDFDNDHRHHDKGMYYCICGVATDIYIENHQGAVVDEWLATQEREEWGVTFDNGTRGTIYSPGHLTRCDGPERAAELIALNPKSGPARRVRRRVSDWEEA